jgi:hypothetical protein
VEAFYFDCIVSGRWKGTWHMQAVNKTEWADGPGRGFRAFPAAILLCLLIAFMHTSCTPGPGGKSPGSGQGMTQTYVQGQFSLTERLSKEKITIAEQLTLVLETEVPENTDVDFPDFSASLGDFSLKDSRILPVRMSGSSDDLRVVHQATYLLEPYLSGIYTIPAMTVTYRDKDNSSRVVQLATREMKINVQSLLPPHADRPEIKDIKPPLVLPPDRVLQLLAAGLVLLLAAAVLSGFIFWRKRRHGTITPPLQLRPEEIALQELERLLAEDLISRGEIKYFHTRISDILRRYIENRFGLHAPERTTEEFLVALSREKSSGHTLIGSHKTLLTDFLTQCDLVKFARHEPTPAETEKTLVICREFIEMTKERGERQEDKGLDGLMA